MVTTLPMFPLEVAMLPGEELPLRIFEPRYAALVRDCLMADDPLFGVVLIEAGREVGGGDRRSDVGVLARIAECAATGEGRYRMRCPLTERIRVTEWLADDPYPRAVVERWPDEPDGGVDPARLADVENRIVALFERIAHAQGGELSDRDGLLARDEADPVVRLYALAARLPMGQADRYAMLSAPGPSARLDALREAVDTVTAMVEFQLSE
jgi:Lon protease-like protein